MSVYHPDVGGNPDVRGCNDDVSTKEVRVSDLSARARQRTDGRTVCPFSVESVFDAYLLHEIARTPRRAARRLMTGAQQTSSRLRAVLVSAGWLFRTEVVEMSPIRR